MTGRFLAVVLLLAWPLMGQSSERVLLLDSGYALPEEMPSDSRTRGATVGIRAADQFELGLQQTVNYAGIGDAHQIGDSHALWRSRTAAFANLAPQSADSKTVPFVGAFLGIDFDDTDASLAMGPQLGLDRYLDNATFLRLRYRYEWALEDIESRQLTRDAEHGEHVISLGVGVNF